MVIDADGLNILAKIDGWHECLPPSTVLTPHPGEMARLCRLGIESIDSDRWMLASDRAMEWQQVVLLKGAYTVIGNPDGRTILLPFANPGLATAGSGDVLAGVIVSLLAQGLPPYSAAVAGGYLHGLSGHMASQGVGNAGMVASDLLPQLPAAIRALSGE
jgi:NAD(P)H-hydrate epimerase